MPLAQLSEPPVALLWVVSPVSTLTGTVPARGPSSKGDNTGAVWFLGPAVQYVREKDPTGTVDAWVIGFSGKSANNDTVESVVDLVQSFRRRLVR